MHRGLAWTLGLAVTMSACSADYCQKASALPAACAEALNVTDQNDCNDRVSGCTSAETHDLVAYVDCLAEGDTCTGDEYDFDGMIACVDHLKPVSPECWDSVLD